MISRAFRLDELPDLTTSDPGVGPCQEPLAKEIEKTTEIYVVPEGRAYYDF
jgi:hypothetical protein